MTAPALQAVGLGIGAGGVTLLEEWDFEGRAGEMVALHGPSGSGKTTLLYALAGLTAPDGGRVAAPAGTPLWRRAPTGLVLQNLCLPPSLTAWETVAVPLQAQGRDRADTEHRVAEALTAVGLDGQRAQLVGELSGGQRQRVAVARAVAAGHDYLLADEPTSALDPHWRAVVLGLLAGEARRGALVLVATSDATVAAACDRQVPVGRPGRHS